LPKRIAAIFAHPDDEVLGCGAVMARHALAGDEVRILILATGLASRGGVPDKAAFERLRADARGAADAVGAGDVVFCDFPDNAMDSVPLLSVIQRIEVFLEAFPAERIYTHHAGDLNIDHRVTHQAVLTACRPLPGAVTREILACEVNSSTEWSPPGSFQPFLPTEFVDVTATLDHKVSALACYKGELRDWPHPRSLEGVRALARWRGAQSGFDAAEAFVTVRRVG